MMKRYTKPTTQRLLCVNCNICVNTLRRYRTHQLDSRVISLIATWISPVIITDDDYLCEACFDVSMQAINSQINGNRENSPSADSSRKGHTQVCFTCGRSLRSNHILKENPSSLILRMNKLIRNIVAPREISQADRVCHACWLRFKRAAVSTCQHDERRDSGGKESVSSEVDQSINSVTIQPQLTVGAGERYVKEEIADLVAAPNVVLQQSSNIILLNYKHAPNTASHCAFYSCENTNLRIISDPLRATLLANYNFYIPKLTRVCREHLYGNSWGSLYAGENSISNFTVDQVEHVFSFVNAFKSFLDFTSMLAVEEMDDHLFGYWMGLTKASFITLLEEHPRLLHNHRGILGFAAVLIKKRTGDSDLRISTLLKVPRTTLERLMNAAREIIIQDCIKLE